MRLVLLCLASYASLLSAEQVRVPERFTEHNLALETTKTPEGYEEIVETVELGSSRYVLGGIIGTTLGMGLGHVVQKRYFVSRAWLYSFIPAVILSAGVLGSIINAPMTANARNTKHGWQNILLLALTLKIPEIIHVWLPEKSREYAAKRKIKFAPVITINSAGGGVAGNL